MVCLDGWALTRALVSPNRLISHVSHYLCRPALSTALCSGRPLHSTAPWSSLCPRSAESPVLTSCCRSPCSSRCASWPRQRKYCSDWKRAEPKGEHGPVHWQTSDLFAWSQMLMLTHFHAQILKLYQLTGLFFCCASCHGDCVSGWEQLLTSWAIKVGCNDIKMSRYKKNLGIKSTASYLFAYCSVRCFCLQS